MLLSSLRALLVNTGLLLGKGAVELVKALETWGLRQRKLCCNTTPKSEIAITLIMFILILTVKKRRSE